MKKIVTILWIAVHAFILAACQDSPEASVTNPAPVQTPPITYEVKYIGADGEEFNPFEEKMFFTDIVIYEDGTYSQLDGDGHLAFYSVAHYLPLCADRIPTVLLDASSVVSITAREGVSFEEITKVDVYGEDGDTYRLIAENISLAEIVQKGEDEWKNRMLYLYFDVGFYDMEASYSKSIQNGYFVKTIF